MTYLDSADALRITEARTAHELNRHGVTLPLSAADQADLNRQAPVGRDGMRDATQVLHWLGY